MSTLLPTLARPPPELTPLSQPQQVYTYMAIYIRIKSATYCVTNVIERFCCLRCCALRTAADDWWLQPCFTLSAYCVTAVINSPALHSSILSVTAGILRSFRRGFVICISAARLNVTLCSVAARFGQGGLRNHAGGERHLASHDLPVSQRRRWHHGVPVLHIRALIWLAQ